MSLLGHYHITELADQFQCKILGQAYTKFLKQHRQHVCEGVDVGGVYAGACHCKTFHQVPLAFILLNSVYMNSGMFSIENLTLLWFFVVHVELYSHSGIIIKQSK